MLNYLIVLVVIIAKLIKSNNVLLKSLLCIIFGIISFHGILNYYKKLSIIFDVIGLIAIITLIIIVVVGDIVIPLYIKYFSKR